MMNTVKVPVIRNVDAFGSKNTLGRRVRHNITHCMDAYVEAQRQWKNNKDVY